NSYWMNPCYFAFLSYYFFFFLIFLSFSSASYFSSRLLLPQIVAAFAFFAFPAMSLISLFKFRQTITRCPAAINVWLLLSCLRLKLYFRLLSVPITPSVFPRCERTSVWSSSATHQLAFPRGTMPTFSTPCFFNSAIVFGALPPRS